MTKEFDPDWTLAPAATLAEWMDEHGLTPAGLARQCCGEADAQAEVLIEDVLGRGPLLESHAGMLERGTGISAQFWLTLESNYRADLAAGRKDMTPRDTLPDSPQPEPIIDVGYLSLPAEVQADIEQQVAEHRRGDGHGRD